jgi:hypothetical protein
MYIRISKAQGFSHIRLAPLAYYEIILAIEVHTIIQIWMSVELGSMTAAKIPIASTLMGAMIALVVMDSLAME